jgi:CRP-like cAMP-binding protein
MATVMEKYTYPDLHLSAPASFAAPPALAASSPLQNRLLAMLPDAERARLLPHLEHVELPLGKVLHECGGSSIFVYFPTTAIVSLMHLLNDGASAEIAAIGCDGVVGFAQLMGGGSAASRAVVQCGGTGYRLKAHFITEEMSRAGPILNLLLRHTQALMTQTAQTAVCNRHHCLDQQLCRWLLLTLDRLPTNEITMTQELIASLLGVRREGVTAAAGRLQAGGLIRYRRGRIAVLDRVGLEKRACECYAVVRGEYERLLPASANASMPARIMNLRAAAQSQRILRLPGNAEKACSLG